MIMRSIVVDSKDSTRRMEMNELPNGVEFVICVNVARRVISVEVSPMQARFVRDELNKYLSEYMGEGA